MRILYLSQWFEPEPNMIKGVAFVRALEKAGNSVTVVTGFPNYPTGKLYRGYRVRPILRETIDGVRIVRLPLYPSHDASTLRRSLNFLSFFVSALIYCLARARRFDVFYVYHPPITVGLAAAIAGSIRRVPFVLDVQDLWPDAIAASGMSGASRLARPVGLLCRLTYERAAAIIAQSRGMARVLTRRGADAARTAVIRNWASRVGSPDSRSGCASRTRTRFTLVYGGNLGRAQGLETVVEAAKLVARERDDIAIRLIGDGIDARRLKACAEGIGNIRIEDAVPQREIEAIFAGADALLLHLRDEPLFRITIPSKVQAYLAAGRPILAAIAGEAADLLARSRSALVLPPQDARALAEAICQIADLADGDRRRMALAARRFYLDEFSFERAIDGTLAVLRAAVARSRSVPLAATT